MQTHRKEAAYRELGGSRMTSTPFAGHEHAVRGSRTPTSRPAKCHISKFQCGLQQTHELFWKEIGIISRNDIHK